MPSTVLVLGASGRFGRHASRAFKSAGWTVRYFDRARDTLTDAASGADVIVNGWNPAYPDWATQVPEQTSRIINAARDSGATVLIPGNVYVFGAGGPETLTSTTPHAAANPLGRVRTAMEAAFRRSDVRTIVLRAGDYIDTTPSGNWFDKVLTKDLRRGVFTWPGALGAPHAWAWLPDMARAAVALAEMRDDLARLTDVPFPGYTLSGREMATALATVTGANVRLKAMSWLPLQLARPFWPMAGHLLEMRYLWSMAHRLDGARFSELLPGFRATPLSTALRRALSLDIHPDEPVMRPLVT